MSPLIFSMPIAHTQLSDTNLCDLKALLEVVKAVSQTA